MLVVSYFSMFFIYQPAKKAVIALVAMTVVVVIVAILAFCYYCCYCKCLAGDVIVITVFLWLQVAMLCLTVGHFSCEKNSFPFFGQKLARDKKLVMYFSFCHPWWSSVGFLLHFNSKLLDFSLLLFQPQHMVLFIFVFSSKWNTIIVKTDC